MDPPVLELKADRRELIAVVYPAIVVAVFCGMTLTASSPAMTTIFRPVACGTAGYRAATVAIAIATTVTTNALR